MKNKELADKVENLWLNIISMLNKSPQEIKTLSPDKAVWFCASTNNNLIFIDRAKTNIPSSLISTTRSFDINEFEKVYELKYAGKTPGEIDDEVSKNPSYIFALINHFDK